MNKPIIDVACGSKMFWFDKKNPNVEFCDIRVIENHEYYPNRFLEIKPDTVCDFTSLPFDDNSFKLVVFDPPHLRRAGETSWLVLKYGKLNENWSEMLRDGFNECIRVLDLYGVLIFKWSEIDIPLKSILACTKHKPLFGHASGRQSKTHWIVFMKGLEVADR